MSLENLKITTYQDNVKDLPDYPSDAGITAAQLKAMFDGRTDKEIKEKFNALVDELVGMFVEVNASITETGETAEEALTGIDEHKESEDAHAAIFQALREELTKEIEKLAGVSGAQKEYTDAAVTKHNSSSVAHSDIRALISNLSASLTGYVKNTDYATADKAGVVKMKDSPFESGLKITRDGTIQIFEALEDDLGSASSAIITTKILEKAVKFVGDGYYATAEDIGEISAALDELHAYAQALINGGAE